MVLVTVESLRTDHLRCYTGRNPTTIHLDRLAAEGIVYVNAYAVTSWTLASHATNFTGLYPVAHQTVEPLDTLGDDYVTVAEILRDRGYECAGVVSGPYLTKRHNLHQGFDYYDESPSARLNLFAHGDVTNEQMTAGISRFLDGRDRDRPFFLFAYYWDPHYDYIPPAPYNERFVTPDHQPIDVTKYERTDTVSQDISPAQLDYVKAQYDGEIFWTDEHLGRLFDLLKTHGLWDDTVVIVTADHGEEFFDHGHKGHKHNLYDETVRVPLIIKLDESGAGPPRRDVRLVSHVDLLPTILDVTGSAPVGAHQGMSLLEEPDPVRPIFFDLLETWYGGKSGRQSAPTTTTRWYAVRRGPYKLIDVPSRSRRELYYVSADPGERRDLSDQPSRHELVEELAVLIDEYRQAGRAFTDRFSRGEKAEPSDEDLERLKSLGYIR